MATTRTELYNPQAASSRQHQDKIQELTSIATHRLSYLQRIAMRQLGNAEDAEDAVQDALLSAHKHLGQFKGQAQMTTWLTRIVINSARMNARKRSRQPLIALDNLDQEYAYSYLADRLADSRPDPETLFRERELADKLTELSEHLSPVLRETFRLRDLNGLNTRESADALAVKDTAIKSRTLRARAHLRRLMQPSVIRQRKMRCDNKGPS